MAGWTRVAALGVVLGALLWPAPAGAQTARERYTRAQAREVSAREALVASSAADAASALLRVRTDIRGVIAAYEAIVRRYPVSGYSDNALFNAAALAEALHERFGLSEDRDLAIRLYRRVGAEYPTSSLVRRADPGAARLEQARAAAAGATRPAGGREAAGPGEADRARLTGIDRTVLDGLVRVTLSLDREVLYQEAAITGPPRVFFDLKGVELGPALTDAVLRYPTDLVRQIRIGHHPESTIRVVLDLDGVGRHTVYALYNPFRLVVDCEPAVVTARSGQSAPVLTPTATAARSAAPAEAGEVAAAPIGVAAAPPAPIPEPSEPPPAAAAANGAGGFSIARQLGLGVSKIVIDPGHGGRDPGAQVIGLNEADLTLDIALRLEALLQKEAGVEVVLTRRTDVYIPLEERTAMANREDADLFLSIHANASRNTAARGIETYFLSFASTPDAEAVAARENSANAGEMRKLPDIIRAITLNNKLDESRDLAAMVQEALVTRLRRSNQAVRNLGVKKAPFVVLIGAEMPSVLAEVSFLTNRQELQLLKTAGYKQRIAEALHAAILRYRRALKGQGAIAAQP